MTDQVQTPEAGAQPQETTSEVENVATEVEQETAETQESQEQPQQTAPKVVPLAALHEERQKRKELQDMVRRGEERLNQLAQIVQTRLQPAQQQQQEVQIPDVNVDPVGHFRAKTELLERQLQELRQPVQDMRQQSEQERAMNALRQHVSVQEAQFAQEQPDYPNALQHMRTMSFQGLKALGYNDAQANALVQQEYAKLAHRVASAGENVAQHIYQMALANGYKAQPAEPSAQEKLQATQKGVQAAVSLGSKGGVTQKLSLQALATMPADEFAKAVSDADFKKLMGG